jgi:uncharacterized membrane protein
MSMSHKLASASAAAGLLRGVSGVTIVKSKLSAALAVVIPVVLAILQTPARADQYTFTTFDVPGYSGTQLNGINDRGQVVGEYGFDGRGGLGSAFVSSNDQITTITVPGLSGTSAAVGINNAGQIVVDQGQGFVYTNGSFASVTVPGAVAVVDDINNNGQIVGILHYPNGVYTGYVATYGSFTPISVPGAYATYTTGINDKGQVVGQQQAPGGRKVSSTPMAALR